MKMDVDRLPDGEELRESDSDDLAKEMSDWLAKLAALNPDSTSIDPGHRTRFRWPPPSTSYGYHLSEADWSRTIQIEVFGDLIDLEVAETALGIFGRSPRLWLDAKGDTEQGMIDSFTESARPFYDRLDAISTVLEVPRRYNWNFNMMTSLQLLKLLFGRDRDVANAARIVIETREHSVHFSSALNVILANRTHPMRRSAQWCALDIYEDLQSYCKNENETREAIDAIKGILWDADNDFARTVYKAGVVLGGHLPTDIGGPVLIECLKSPSRIGRRSVIHALFHVVEWAPELQNEIVEQLRNHASTESDPDLRVFALRMAADIELEQTDCVPEPVFPEELAVNGTQSISQVE